MLRALLEGERRLTGLGLRPEPVELLAIDIGQAEATSAADEEVEHGPGEAQAARLAGKAADDLHPPLYFLQGAFEQVRGAQALAQPPG